MSTNLEYQKDNIERDILYSFETLEWESRRSSAWELPEMKMSTLSSQFHLLKYPVKYSSYPSSNPNSFIIPISLPKHPQPPTILSSLPSEATNNIPLPTREAATKSKLCSVTLVRQESVNDTATPRNSTGNNLSRFWVMGAVSVGVAAWRPDSESIIKNQVICLIMFEQWKDEIPKHIKRRAATQDTTGDLYKLGPQSCKKKKTIKNSNL